MSLRHAILGFLDLEPATGYTLLQRFEGSVGSFWTATQSQVYRELHALEAAGQVRMTLQPQDGKPARKIYALTAGGRAALEAWLHEPLEPTQLRDALQLRLVFSASVPPARLDAMLASYAERLQATLQEYRERLASTQILSLARSARERTLWALSVENGVAWCEAQLVWVRHARRRLARVGSATAPTRARQR
ncbi:MAG: PadR family transcriptional regulator [Ideonella sp.]|nr:PadR family transcriptional regulator [Ideonella sp.]